MPDNNAILGLIDDEAERIAVAALIQSQHRGEVMDIIRPESFHDPRRKVVATAIMALVEADQAITMTAVLAECRYVAARLGLSVQINKETIAAMQTFPVGESPPAVAVRTVNHLARLRMFTPELEELTAAIASRASEGKIRAAIGRLLEAALSRESSDERILLGSAVPGLVDSILERTRQSPGQTLYPWPWTGSFSRVAPLAPGMLAIWGAPDGHGKTTAAMTVAHHWASIGHQVVYIHTEYDHRYMVQRIMCAMAGININALLQNNITEKQRERLERAKAYWAEKRNNFHLISGGGMTADDVVAIMRTMRREGRMTALFVDYFQDLDFPGRDRWTTMEDSAKAIHHALAECEVPGFWVAQGNKTMLDVAPKDMHRGMIGLPAGVIRKAQCFVVTKQMTIPWDGAETVYIDGKPTAWGKAGQKSPVVPWVCDKQTNGMSGVSGYLQMGSNFAMTDLPLGDPRREGEIGTPGEFSEEEERTTADIPNPGVVPEDYVPSAESDGEFISDMLSEWD